MIGRVGFATALLSTGILATGCGNSNTDSPEYRIATPNIAHVDGGDAEDINKWLANNQGSRIVSFTGILAYRDRNSGYDLVVEPGDNSGQNCVAIGRAEEDIQAWINANPGRLLLGIASVPEYGGGVAKFIVCSDATEG